MNHIEISLLLNTLKKLLKAQKWTYKRLAAELQLSEISIKRIFSERDCSLSRLSEICELLGTSIIEVSELAKASTESENYFLTEQQENVFADRPSLFAIFRQLYRGDGADEVKKDWGLTSSSFFKTLQELEKLNLLEVHPQNRYKFKISGRLRLNQNGKVFNRIIKKQNTDFLEAVYRQVDLPECSFQSSELQMSKTTLHAMVSELHELGKRYRSQSYHEERTLPKTSLIDVRWLIAFLPYTTDWRKYDNKG